MKMRLIGIDRLSHLICNFYFKLRTCWCVVSSCPDTRHTVQSCGIVYISWNLIFVDSGILWVHLTHQFQSHHNVELTHYSLKYFNETTNPRTCKNIYNPRNFAPTNSTDLTVHSALQKSIQVNICHTMLKETNH